MVRHVGPTVIAHVVDVAVAAVDVAAAGDFDEDSIEFDHVPTPLAYHSAGAVVPVMHPVVGVCVVRLFIAHFLDQPSERWA
jgi:hypothetical protein